MKILKNKALQLIASVYCVLYFVGFVLPFFTGEMSFSNSEDVSVLGAFLLFFFGFALSWGNEGIGGYLLQSWVFSIWALGLFYWTDAGMVIVLSVPVLVIGVFLSRKAYLKSGEPKSKQSDRKFTLQLFLYNYGLLYLLIVASDLVNGKHAEYLRFPSMLFPILLMLFAAGFAFSFRNEKIAGSMMVLWYVIVILSSILFFKFSNSGPWFIIGIPVLLHGIMYLKYHSDFERFESLK
ncbi:MAG TPA: hypothetical protein VK213_05770 [Bacteroidales bacterium]|nr:hypothetical protein [Bacteroidales bacterium]